MKIHKKHFQPEIIPGTRLNHLTVIREDSFMRPRTNRLSNKST